MTTDTEAAHVAQLEQSLLDLASTEETLDDGIVRIEEQLNTARLLDRFGGKKYDVTWFESAKKALKTHQRQKQRILQRKAAINRQIRRVYDSTFERVFIRQAEALLPRETYFELIEKTKLAVSSQSTAVPVDDSPSTP